MTNRKTSAQPQHIPSILFSTRQCRPWPIGHFFAELTNVSTFWRLRLYSAPIDKLPLQYALHWMLSLVFALFTSLVPYSRLWWHRAQEFVFCKLSPQPHWEKNQKNKKRTAKSEPDSDLPQRCSISVCQVSLRMIKLTAIKMAEFFTRVTWKFTLYLCASVHAVRVSKYLLKDIVISVSCRHRVVWFLEFSDHDRGNWTVKKPVDRVFCTRKFLKTILIHLPPSTFHLGQK